MDGGEGSPGGVGPGSVPGDLWAEGWCYLGPAFGNRLFLGRTETRPMCPPCRTGIYIKQPTDDGKILLMEHKGGGFPKIIVKILLEIMLGCA